jgi:hypothetical protein
MQLQGHFQNAYVTRDLDAAIELFRVQYGFAGFSRHEVSYECKTPVRSGTATVKLALGWIGNIQYELIQPVSGVIDVYTDCATADATDRSVLHFHHICMRVSDWDEFRAQLDREKQAVVAEGGTPGHLLWLYVDARRTLGHYLEYCWMTPERWQALGGAP